MISFWPRTEFEPVGVPATMVFLIFRPSLARLVAAFVPSIRTPAGQPITTELNKLSEELRRDAAARLQQLHAPGRLEQSLSEHLAVFAALKARDPEGAEAAMKTHLTRQREALRDLARSQRTKVLA